MNSSALWTLAACVSLSACGTGDESSALKSAGNIAAQMTLGGFRGRGRAGNRRYGWELR